MGGLPEHIRAWIFLIFALAAGAAFAAFMFRQKSAPKWTLIWFAIPTVAFFSGNFFVLAATMFVIAIFAIPGNPASRVAYFFLMLPMLPEHVNYEVPGIIPGIRYLMELNYPRLVILFVLFPVFVVMLHKMITRPRGSEIPRLMDHTLDRIVILFLLVVAVLGFRGTSPTDAMRNSLYLIIDFYIPYFVISRAVTDMESFRKVFSAIMFSGILLAFVAVISEATKWNLYTALPRELLPGVSPLVRFHDFRGPFLRVAGPMGSPLVFGYFFVLGLAALFYARSLFANRPLALLATFGLFSTALVFTMSRGPWLSAIVLVTAYIFLVTRDRRLRGVQLVAGAAAFGAMIALISGGFDAIDPYNTFEYRRQLIGNSLDIVRQNLLLGSSNYMDSAALEASRQGQGIIDIVNSYLRIALSYGIVGLSLFIGMFIWAIRLVSRYRKRYPDFNDPHCRLGATLIAAMIGTLVMIGTVSSITFVPYYYWALIGLASAYIRMERQQEQEERLAGMQEAGYAY